MSKPKPWSLWQRLIFLLVVAWVALPFLPWMFLMLGHPFPPHWSWNEVFFVQRRTLWLVLPGMALLSAWRLSPILAILAMLPAFVLSLVLMLMGFFAQTCAIGRTLATRPPDGRVPEVQVVECAIHIFHWYRVQQADGPLPLQRIVATYIIGQDDSSPPKIMRFELRNAGRSMVLSGLASHSYSPRDPDPKRYDLVLFDLDSRGRLRHHRLDIDDERVSGWQYLHGSRFPRRHAEVRAALSALNAPPPPSSQTSPINP